MAVAGEAPVRLKLSVAPDAWVVDSERPPRVHVQAIYERKRTPRAVTLTGSTDIGELSPLESQSVESATATWNLPANLGGRRQAKLQVQTGGPRPVKSELVIQLRPGPPAAAKITVQPGHLKSDGRSEAQLVVEVRDAHGNPLDVAPEVMQSKGTVSRFKPVSSGVFTATYRAPQSSSLDHDDVSIRVAKTQIVRSVVIGLTPATDRWRLWGTLGYSTNFAKVHGPTATVGGGVRLPVLRERVIVGADVGYYGHQTSELDAKGEEVVSVKTTVVPVMARVTYELRLSDFSPYLGVGGGIGVVRFDISSPSSGNFTQWKGRPTLSGMVGTLWRLGPGSALVEVMYRAISVNELAVSGNVGGLAMTAGYLYEF
jgi:opacity protein-like surface antigen